MKRRKLKAVALLISVLAITAAVAAVLNFNHYDKEPQASSASEHSSSESPRDITDSYIIENVGHICQLDKWPNGYESVSAVMALNFFGIDVSVDYFIDNYLEMSALPFDPYKTYGGNPRDGSGFGCYAPVIKSALDKALEGSDYAADIVSSATWKAFVKSISKMISP